MIKVLSVASECVPLVKTGGLADVAGALPEALAAQNVEMRTLLPGYPQVMGEVPASAAKVAAEDDLFGGPAHLLQAKVGTLELYVLDAPHLFQRGGSIYLGPDGRDWPDNPERFAALCWIAARIGANGLDNWTPDIVHLHDWQAGLTPAYLAEMTNGKPAPGTVLTIHNIAFQGLTEASRMESLRLPPEGFHPGGYEYYGNISALKAGLVSADRLTTVSPTYARELMTPEFGMGLDGVLRSREADLSGVLNGIDTTVWDPAADPHLPSPYSEPGGKVANKLDLREVFGLPPAHGPLCVVISRMTSQKGLDLLLQAMPALLAEGGQLAVLGSGDPSLEHAWREAAAHYPNVAVRIGYDEPLSHLMIGGGDAILVPSRFEPCGLTQLYGLRYGTPPVVALTGGLADTVIPATPATEKAGVATGIQFYPVSAGALADSLRRVCTLYADADAWQKIQGNAMAHPVGWDVSARNYAHLYESLVTSHE